KILAGASDVMVRWVEANVANFKDRGLRYGASAADGSQMSEQDIDRKWFGQVIVRSGIESADDVGRRITSRQHQHWSLIPRFAQPPGNRDAVKARKHEIEYDNVEGRSHADLERLAAVVRDHYLVSLFGQRAVKQLRHPKVVFGHENLH